MAADQHAEHTGRRQPDEPLITGGAPDCEDRREDRPGDRSGAVEHPAGDTGALDTDSLDDGSLDDGSLDDARSAAVTRLLGEAAPASLPDDVFASIRAALSIEVQLRREDPARGARDEPVSDEGETVVLDAEAILDESDDDADLFDTLRTHESGRFGVNPPTTYDKAGLGMTESASDDDDADLDASHEPSSCGDDC